MTNAKPLSSYWEAHKLQGPGPSREIPDSPLDYSANGSKTEPASSLRRSRTHSDAAGLEPTMQALAPFHPALSLRSFIETFGPLVFPLYRAALLRKRILLVTEVPVHLPCDYGKRHSTCEPCALHANALNSV